MNKDTAAQYKTKNLSRKLSAGRKGSARKQSRKLSLGKTGGRDLDLKGWLESTGIKGKSLETTLKTCQAEDIEEVSDLRLFFERLQLDQMGFKMVALVKLKQAFENEKLKVAPKTAKAESPDAMSRREQEQQEQVLLLLHVLLLHVSFGTEKTVNGEAAFPILLTQCIDVVNSKTDGYQMQEMLPIGINDPSWWPKWVEQLVGSQGVIIIATETYWEKLETGTAIYVKKGTYEVEGAGIKREADRIIQQREKDPTFKVFVVDGGAIGPNDLRTRITDGFDEINYVGWMGRVKGFESSKRPKPQGSVLLMFSFEANTHSHLLLFHCSRSFIFHHYSWFVVCVGAA